MRDRIRLSDKVSGHRSRKVGRHCGELDEPQRIVEVLVRQDLVHYRITLLSIAHISGDDARGEWGWVFNAGGASALSRG